MKIERDWKEEWVDRMGLIVCLDGEARFQSLCQLKTDMAVKLTPVQQRELKECLRQRFTPTNGGDGCKSAVAAVDSVLDRMPYEQAVVDWERRMDRISQTRWYQVLERAL